MIDFDPTAKPEMYDDKWSDQVCPYCRRGFTIKPVWIWVTQTWQGDFGYFTLSYTCPHSECKKQIIHLVKGKFRAGFADGEDPFILTSIETIERVLPPGSARPPAKEQVPGELADDYNEACLVLPYSAKASAALSRRCLQHLLELQGIPKSRLADMIEKVLEQHGIPAHIRDTIDAIRHFGNYAAHPIESHETGEIIEVEPEEAEWTLDILEALFDFHYVHPEELRKRREALEKKLEDGGSGKLKG